MASKLKVDEILDRLGTGPVKATEGLLLPNVAKAGSGTLDWYEEGVWTPVLSAATPGTLAVVYSVQWGVFTRIGRLVTAQFRLDISSITLGTATGEVRFLGLPHAPANFGPGRGFTGPCMTSGFDNAIASPVFWMDSNLGGAFTLHGTTDNVSWASTSISGVSAGDAIIGQLTYFAG